MTARLLGCWPDGSPEWHAARVGRIGGSDIGVVMGWSPYLSAGDLLSRKRGELPDRGDTAATIRGRYLESAVAQWLADTEQVTYDESMTGTWVDGDHDWMMFNPDRVTTDGRLVEIKTASEKSLPSWGRAGTDQIPLTYQAQVHWGMGILGLPSCLVGVCFGSPFEFRRYRVRFDAEVFAALRGAAERFIHDMKRAA